MSQCFTVTVPSGVTAGGIVSGTALLLLFTVIITVTVIICGTSRRRKLNANLKLNDARYVDQNTDNSCLYACGYSM